MTLQQYVTDLIANSWNIADVYDEGNLNDVCIEVIEPSIRQILLIYLATTSQAPLTDIGLQAESLLPIEEGSGKNPKSNSRVPIRQSLIPVNLGVAAI